MVPDFAEDSTIRLGFVSTASDGTPTAPSAAFTAADFAVYKDGSATQKATTNGITVTSPFDSITGRHLLSIDTSNDTGDAGFWAAGSVYEVVLSTAKTVDSKSVSGYSVGEFRLGGVRIDSTSVTAVQSGLSTFDAGSDTVTVGTNNDKTDYSLTAGTGLGNQTANITGNLSGSVGSVTAGVTVTTNNDKGGYSLTVAPPTAATIADAVWDETTAAHTTAGTYGGQVVRSTNSNNAVQVTGSNHIAADVHEFQADVLTSDATAASFVTEVQSGLATAANQTTILNRLGSWTGSGLNTILGAFRALAGKAASLTPSDISSGTTYDNTTDSLEAIRDRGDAAWAPGEAGSGDASQSTLLAVQDQVEAIAGTLGGTAISVTSRIADGGAMVVYTGDDLKVRSGTQVTVSISDPAGGIYSRLSALGTSQLSWGAARQSQAAGAISGTISSLTQSGSGDAQVVNLVIEILDAGQSLNPADDYIWQVASTSSSGDEYTEIEGTLDLRRRVAVPVTA